MTQAPLSSPRRMSNIYRHF